jgi:ABC-type cobalamin transport system ATPase subunit
MNAQDLATRRAQLIAQSELDRVRLAHALLQTRQSMNPMSALRGAPLASFAVPAVAFAVPLLLGARRVGLLRLASFALTAIRTLRGFRR